MIKRGCKERNTGKCAGRYAGKKAQVTVFVIIAIVIIAAIGGYFLLRSRISIGEIPQQFVPVYNYFEQCVEAAVEEGSEILGAQAGYIEMPEFEPGSEYRPFSSQLEFLGSGIPYWYYVAGNNIIKEQTPSKKDMENQLADFIANELDDCSFAAFERQGFIIRKGKPKVSVKIEDNKISAEISMDLSAEFAEKTARRTKHSASINSRLGKFYSIAIDIYNNEKANAFLENYAVDVMRLYAPVTGVEMSCSPMFWKVSDIEDELKAALGGNMQAIKLKGNYYSKANKYFVQDTGQSIDENINFLYSSEWPTRIEIWPSETEEAEETLLLAEPVGLQEGLGVLGFCYVPYHFVYDINYPVLVQIFNERELFQFPVAIIIEKNKPREALPGTALDTEVELCKYKVENVDVYTYNTALEPVEADISFKCFDTSCDIGKTKTANQSVDAVLSAKFPQCVNGFIIAKSEGYATKKYQISTNKPGTANVLLDKLYDIELDISVDNLRTNDNVLINFDGENSFTVYYPEQNKVQLSEGQYNITAYVYSTSSIYIQSTATEKCVDVPKSGLLGIFGTTEEKCFDINIPAQTLDQALSGGGKSFYYITESELATGKLHIDIEGISKPSSLEELQDNYNLIEVQQLNIEFG